MISTASYLCDEQKQGMDEDKEIHSKYKIVHLSQVHNQDYFHTYILSCNLKFEGRTQLNPKPTKFPKIHLPI